MKANELMIGDYISVKPSGMLIKVAAVHHKKVAYHAVVNKLAWVRESLLEPIPLTPEILEKNGLVKAENPRTGTIMYSFRDSLFRIEVYDFEHVIVVSVYTNSMYEGFINNVHELQHALRLCGINKEIIV